MTKLLDSNIHIHKQIGKPDEIHNKYGLWICEYNKNNYCTKNYSNFLRSFDFYSIAHLVDGKGIYIDNNKTTHTVLSGEAILIFPEVIHWYSAADNNFWLEDSLAFTGPSADRLAECGIIKNGIIRFGRSRRLQPIIEAASNPAMDSQIKANSMLEKLLIDLYFEQKNIQKDHKYPIINSILSEINSNPYHWWTVSEITEKSRLNKDYFRDVFKEVTGITPKMYIDKIKINKAIELLTGTNDSIQSIAEKLGYQDPYHFSRRFKELCKLSPIKYRQRSL